VCRDFDLDPTDDAEAPVAAAPARGSTLQPGGLLLVEGNGVERANLPADAGQEQANREPELLGGAAPKRGLFSFLRG